MSAILNKKLFDDHKMPITQEREQLLFPAKDAFEIYLNHFSL